MARPTSTLMDRDARPTDDRTSRITPSRPSISKNLSSYHVHVSTNADWNPAHTPKSSLGRHLNTKSILPSWWWELLGAICSLAFLAGVLTVLYIVDNKPIDKWHFQIQPNALVSILATISKGALMLTVAECLGQLKWVYFSISPQRMRYLEAFDAASRGPAGAFSFFFGLRGRHFLAKIAALVTIMAVLMEPFIQQVISFSTRKTPVETYPSTLAIAQAYDHGPKANESDELIDSSLFLRGVATGALYGVERKPTFACMGSECIWRNISTLGVCSTCEDVSSEISRSCGKLEYAMVYTNEPPGGTMYYMDYCNFTLPGHPMLMAKTVGSRRPDSTTTFNSSFYSPSVHSLNQSSSELGTFVALLFPEYQTAPIPAPNVTKCTLTMCANIYATTAVTNGTYRSADPQSVPFWEKAYDGSRNYVYHVDIGAYPDFPGNTGYSVNKYSELDLQDSLTALLTGSNYGKYTTEYRALSRSSNLSETIMNITTALTNGLRDCSPNRSEVQGLAFTLEAYIEVQWPWMILPCLLVVAGNALLITTIVLSNERDAPLWRNSALAVLFTGMNEQDRQRIDHSNLLTQRGMEKEAKKVRVSLGAGTDGRRELKFHFPDAH